MLLWIFIPKYLYSSTVSIGSYLYSNETLAHKTLVVDFKTTSFVFSTLITSSWSNIRFSMRSIRTFRPAAVRVVK